MYTSVALVLNLTCLNVRVSGLGLGPTTDPPVTLDWSSVKIKVLGVSSPF